MCVWNTVPFSADAVQLLPGAKETILRLVQKFQLGLVTSRDRADVFESPALGRLREQFSVVAAYEDTPEHKPSPAPLLFATQELGLAPEACLYTGDTFVDEAAARAAGVPFVGFGAYDFPPDVPRVRDFPGLEAYLLRCYA